MSYVVVTAPVAEPLSVAEFKLAARVTNTAEDTLISDIIIPAARRRYETDTRRQVVTATYDYFLDDFTTAKKGDGSCIEIPKPPLASITSVKYFDTDGVEQTFDSSKYLVSSGKVPGVIAPVSGEQWPETQSTRPLERVTIRFVAGVDVSAVDPVDKQAMSLLALHWFENREAVVVDQRIATDEVPLGYTALMMNRQITEF